MLSVVVVGGEPLAKIEADGVVSLSLFPPGDPHAVSSSRAVAAAIILTPMLRAYLRLAVGIPGFRGYHPRHLPPLWAAHLFA